MPVLRMSVSVLFAWQVIRDRTFSRDKCFSDICWGYFLDCLFRRILHGRQYFKLFHIGAIRDVSNVHTCLQCLQDKWQELAGQNSCSLVKTAGAFVWDHGSNKELLLIKQCWYAGLVTKHSQCNSIGNQKGILSGNLRFFQNVYRTPLCKRLCLAVAYE